MMSTLRLRAAAGADADERASGCLVVEAAEVTLRFRVMLRGADGLATPDLRM